VHGCKRDALLAGGALAGAARRRGAVRRGEVERVVKGEAGHHRDAAHLSNPELDAYSQRHGGDASSAEAPSGVCDGRGAASLVTAELSGAQHERLALLVR